MKCRMNSKNRLFVEKDSDTVFEIEEETLKNPIVYYS